MYLRVDTQAEDVRLFQPFGACLLVIYGARTDRVSYPFGPYRRVR